MDGKRPGSIYESRNPHVSSQNIKDAIDINQRLSFFYNQKFPQIPRDEFTSAGYVGIAKANKKFRAGNWGGYVKVSIQNEMLSYCRQHRRYVRDRDRTYQLWGRVSRVKQKRLRRYSF